jgi:hypothetical protein|tara:strand:- start:2651 stop:3376 length:726 start_codon:yes stop_codon:yes gene_type:complete
MEKPIFEIKNNNKIIFVIFGGILQALGMEIPPFEFVNSLKEKKLDVIFIRDFKQAWYSFGVEGLGKNIEETSNNLCNKISKYNHIITMGNSMGGYAAILFAEMINANFSIAINPQTFIDKKNREVFRDNRWNDNISKIHEKIIESKYFDLKNIVSDSLDKKTRHMVFFGENEELDKNHAIRFLNNENFKIFMVKNTNHDAAKHLKNEGILDKILNSINTEEANFEDIISKLDNEKNLRKYN